MNKWPLSPSKLGIHLMRVSDAFKTGPPVNVILKLLRTKLFHLLMFNLLLNISRGLLCRYMTRVSESSEVPMRMNTLVYILMPIK